MALQSQRIEPLIPMPFLKLVIAYKLHHLPPRAKVDVRELTLKDCEVAWDYSVSVDRSHE